MPDPREEFGELWRSVNREVHDRFRKSFKDHEQPIGTLFLLRYITRHPGVTVSELARQVGVVKSHVSKMVEQLVQQGYASKEPDEADQRLSRLQATPAGAALMNEMEALAKASWAEVINQVPEGQLDQVLEGLRILLTALRRANAERE